MAPLVLENSPSLAQAPRPLPALPPLHHLPIQARKMTVLPAWQGKGTERALHLPEDNVIA